MRRDFDLDLKDGEKVEKEVAHLLSEKMKNLHYVEKVDHARYPFDLRLTLKDKEGRHTDVNIEVKALEGRKFIHWGSKKIAEMMDTGVVEVWDDDYKQKRPHWFSDQTDIIVFKNKARGKFYFYRAQPVIEHLKNWTGHLTYAKNDCDDTSGWLMKFYWSPDEAVHPRFRDESMFLPGFMFSMDGIVEDECPLDAPNYL